MAERRLADRLGTIWLIDAVLKWLPGFRSGYLGMISAAGQGQPGWLHWWFSFWTNIQRPEVAFFAYAVAAAETLIAIAVILGVARKITYISAAAFSVLIWAVAEGFGGPYTSGASDIGTAIIYAIVFLGLPGLMAYSGPARYSLDYYLEQRISWWWRVAEIGRPIAQLPVPATAAFTAGPTASSPASIPQPRALTPDARIPTFEAFPLTPTPAAPAASDGHAAAGHRPA